MKAQIIYIIPQALFESDGFHRNDVKVYGRIRMLPHGLTTTRKKFGEMIDMPLVSVKRSVTKLLKAGWLIEHEGAIKTLDHGPLSDAQGITDDTLVDSKVSPVTPKGITHDTHQGITDDTPHNISNIEKNINKNMSLRETSISEMNIDIPTPKQEPFSLEIEEELIYPPNTEHIGGFTKKQFSELKEKYQRQFGPDGPEMLKNAIEGYDEWFGDNKKKKDYAHRTQKHHFNNLLRGPSFKYACENHTIQLRNKTTQEYAK